MTLFDAGHRVDDPLAKVFGPELEIVRETYSSLIRKSGRFGGKVLYDRKSGADLRVSIGREGLKRATTCRTSELIKAAGL